MPRAPFSRRAARRSAWEAERLRRRARAVWEARHRRSYAGEHPRIPSREELPVLLNRRGLLGTGAEIGVKVGSYSDLLLRTWRGRKLISIDPWLEADAGDYDDTANVPQGVQERFYADACARLARHGERSEVWRMTSAQAATRVADAELDFAYIDARHDYASVREDLELWLPRIRPGGVLAGHDYVSGAFPQGHFEVRRAVDDFFAERGIAVLATGGTPPRFPSWIVLDPGHDIRRQG
jgi:hypothetical protein